MTLGHLLLADDEPVFLASTADLLRAEGYTCETAPDGAAALALVRESAFDLLITDLEMPGNEDLALVRAVSRDGGGLPCIILTGFPSVRSAVASIELPVAAYLVKPVAFTELRDRTAMAVTRYRSYQAMRQAEERLLRWRAELQADAVSHDRTPNGEVDMFLTLALRNIMGNLTDLSHLGRALAGGPVTPHTCVLMNCPRGAQLLEAVRTTVEVLIRTKGSFKSRELGELRHMLELLLQHH